MVNKSCLVRDVKPQITIIVVPFNYIEECKQNKKFNALDFLSVISTVAQKDTTILNFD